MNTFTIISLDSVAQKSLQYKNDLYSDEKVRRRRRSCSIRAGVVGQLPVYALTKSENSAGAHTEMNNEQGVRQNEGEREEVSVADTLSADLAVAVGVTGLQESGGLGVGQCAGTSLEILQEKPSEAKQVYASDSSSINKLSTLTLLCVSLQLLLLDEPALVLVDDVEGLLQLLPGLAGQPAGGEELLVFECAIGYNRRGAWIY